MKWDKLLFDSKYGWLIIYGGCLLYMTAGLLIVLAILGKL